MIGFTFGVLIKLFKKKILKEDDDGKYHPNKIMKSIMDFMEKGVLPLYKLAISLGKGLFSIIDTIVDFTIKHPTISAIIAGFLFSLKHLDTLKVGYNAMKLVKNGVMSKIGVSMLLGTGVAMATEAIMGNLFKSKKEDKDEKLLRLKKSN